MLLKPTLHLVALLLIINGSLLVAQQTQGDKVPSKPDSYTPLRTLHTQIRSKYSAAVSSPASIDLFLQAPQIATGVNPVSIVAGDFNNDGKDDLVVVNYCADANCIQSSLSIFLGKGDGTFRARVDVLAGVGTAWITTGDFNNDGKLDLATANICSDQNCISSSISVWLGNGDGTFQRNIDFPTGPGPLLIASADLNSDNKLDLVTGDFFGTASVLIGNGNGSFQPNVEYPAASCPSDTQSACVTPLAIADFNNDHKPDLAVPDLVDGSLTLLLGNGDGTFQTQFRSGNVGSPSALASADFDGDGNQDLVVNSINGNLADKIVIFLGNGDGSFKPGVAYTTGVDPIQVIVADFNNDHKEDVAAVNCLGDSVSVFPGVGDGTFPYHEAWGVGLLPIALVAGDFNGDGNKDIAAVNSGDNSVSILLGRGDSTFKARIDSDTYVDPGSVASADFNGDGKLDLVTVNYIYSNVSVLLGKGDGTFQTHVDYPTPIGPLSVITGDFNLDGKADFALTDLCDSTCSSTYFSIFLGNGDGTFRPRLDVALPLTDLNAQFLTSADFDRDGIPDLAVTQAGGDLNILLGNGDGTFRHIGDYPARGPVAAADFNGDGKVDLALANASNLTIFLGKGDGTFRAPTDFPVGFQTNWLAIGDFNGDGKPDVAVPDVTDPSTIQGTISIFINNGDGTFQPPVQYNTSNRAASVATGDFNGDHRVDLAVTGDAPVNVLLGKGDGTFQAPIVYEAGIGTGGIAVTDLNADGKPDLVITNATSYTVSALMNIAAIPTVKLAISISGGGTGAVTINPGVITCPANCSRLFEAGSTVTLLAHPNEDSLFEGWTGVSGCSGSVACNITLSSDQNVTANFNLVPDFALTVSGFSPPTIIAGESATSNIGITAIGSFNGSVSLSCSVTPTPQFSPTCTISPSSAFPGGQATVTVLTTARTNASILIINNDRLFVAFLFPLFGIAVVTVRLCPNSRKVSNPRAILLLVLAFGLALQIACGGGSKSSEAKNGTPAGSYTIAVSGTSGSTTHITKVVISIQ